MIIRANLKYSIQHRSWRVYHNNVVVHPKRDTLSNLVFLDHSLQPIPKKDNNFNHVSYILKYQYTGASIRPPHISQSDVKLDPNLNMLLFIPLQAQNDSIRVLNCDLSTKNNIKFHLTYLAHQDLEWLNSKSLNTLIT